MTVDPSQILEPDVAFPLLGGIYLLMSVIAGVHVVLNKQNEASAFSWLGIIVFAPLLAGLAVLVIWHQPNSSASAG